MSRGRRREPPADQSFRPPQDPKPEPLESERERFGRFAKKLVNVPKREIDEKAKEWERRKDR